MKILFGMFLVAHALMHASYLTPKPDDPKYPFYFDKSWSAGLLGSAASWVGTSLVVLTLLSFGLAALGYVGVGGLAGAWKELATAGAVMSLTTLVVFWHPWLVLGIAIDLALIYALVQLDWSPS